MSVTALVLSVYKCAANCNSQKGHIPLHYAAYNGHLEVVKYFVERTCFVTLWTGTIMVGHLFTTVCDNGHLKIAQYLIREEHCNSSCEDNSGTTPLQNASGCNASHRIQLYSSKQASCKHMPFGVFDFLMFKVPYLT